MKRILLILATTYIGIMVFGSLVLVVLNAMNMIEMNNAMSFITTMILIIAMFGSIAVLLFNADSESD